LKEDYSGKERKFWGNKKAIFHQDEGNQKVKKEKGKAKGDGCLQGSWKIAPANGNQRQGRESHMKKKKRVKGERGITVKKAKGGVAVADYPVELIQGGSKFYGRGMTREQKEIGVGGPLENSKRGKKKKNLRGGKDSTREGSWLYQLT